MSHDDLGHRLAAVARDLQQKFDPDATYHEAARLAVVNVDGADAASLSIVERRRRLSSQGATEDLAHRADTLQHELGEGPCLDAVWEHELVTSSDLRTDERWPTWGPRVVAETGARSVLSVRLFVHGDTLGALNMYSTQYDGFAAQDLEDAEVLAAPVAIAVAAAREIQGLERSLDSRALIGQALGIAMERYDLDAARAMALLVRISSAQNKKLRDVALGIIATRTIGTDTRSSPRG